MARTANLTGARDGDERMRACGAPGLIHRDRSRVVMGEEPSPHTQATGEAPAVVVGSGVSGRPGEDQVRDLALMRRVRARDAAALATLYDCYAAQVTGLARSVLRDPEASEEVTHDVFLRVWQRPEAYDPARGTFAGWVSRVARNRAIDLLRQRRDTADDDAVARVPDPAPDPAEQTMAHLRRQEVRAALAELPAEQRELLELAYFTGLSQRQIAERLQRPLGTVKSQVRAAMHRLAERLAPPDHHTGDAPSLPEGSR